MMQILKKSKTIMAALLLIFQLLVPLTQVKAVDNQVTDQLIFYQKDQPLSGKDVEDKLKVKVGDTAVLSLKRKDKDQASKVKVALPELFAFEKDDTIKANQELLDKGSKDLKKLDAASLVELKKEDKTSYLLFHFNAGQDEIKFALKGVKEGSGQLLAAYKEGDQDYISYPVSAVVEIAEAKADGGTSATRSADGASSSSASSSSQSSENATEKSSQEQASSQSSEDNSSSASSSSASANSSSSSTSSSSASNNDASAQSSSEASASSSSSSSQKEDSNQIAQATSENSTSDSVSTSTGVSEDKKSTETETNVPASSASPVVNVPKLAFRTRMLAAAPLSTAVTSDANVDLTVNADNGTSAVASGDTVLYTVNFKVSGSKYDEANRWPATLTFSLKNTANGHLYFNTDTVPTIDGIKPVATSDKLVYTFNSKDELRAGQAYAMKLAVKTDNGYLNNNTPVDMVGTFKDATGYQKSVTANAKISATTNVSITKSFLTAESAKPNTAPGAEDTLAWRISVSVPNRSRGLNFLDPSKKIQIVDTISGGSVSKIVADDTFSVKSISGETATFELTTPTLEEQKTNLDAPAVAPWPKMPIYTKSFIVYTKPNGSWPGTKVSNTATINAQNLQGETHSATANATAQLGVAIGSNGDSDGKYLVPNFEGPSDGESDSHFGLNPITTVYDTAKIGYYTDFYPAASDDMTIKKYDSSGNYVGDIQGGWVQEKVRTGFRERWQWKYYSKGEYFNNKIMEPEVNNGLRKKIVHYDIDPHIIIKNIQLRNPGYQIYAGTPVIDQPASVRPGVLITLTVKNMKTGATRTLKSKYMNIDQNYWPLSYFGATEDERLISADFSIQHENPEELIDARTMSVVWLRGVVEKGFVGDAVVTNKLTTVMADGTTYTRESTDPNNSIGPRTLRVIKPGNTIPVARIETAFKKDAPEGKGIVTKNSPNRVIANFYNDSSSQADMKSPTVFSVLLPKGVTPSSATNLRLYLVNDSTGEEKELLSGNETRVNSGTGNWAGASYEYSYDVKGGAKFNTGQRYVKFVLNDGKNILKPGWHLRGEVDVDIGDVSGSLTLQAFGGSYTGKLTAPTGYTVLNNKSESEVSDGQPYNEVTSVMGDGNIKQVVTNSSDYGLSGYDQVKIQKFVKGSEDSDYGQMAHTTRGGTINYRLQITAGQQVDKLTLMDVLPSVGDYGITDNVNRESKFTPVLTGPISVSGLSGATIKYSTAANPSRSVLNNSITLPNGGTKLVDKNTESPTWLTADQVTDWSKIHSFLITSGTGTIKTAQTATLDFSMRAPKIEDMSQSQQAAVLDQSIAEKDRAAWNSFAVTANNLMPVEPERVGVVMNDSGVRILKKANLTNENLTGVKFKLADSEANAKAGKFLHIKDGKVLTPSDSGYDSASDYEATSKDGVVQFHGLTDDKTYYAVETEALSGYKLDSTPHAVVASYKPSSKEITVYNHRDVILPKTGSSWMALFLIVGISGIAAGFYFSRKGKEDK
ncbi:Cna protein B-type domain protein [Lactobacillus equicursoris 66c]|uniref:Cna protein B-type domain protein n=1 Tax=Lactobacillus equicursoris 66c TaxID=872326 RepID=K0NTL9_9LACO|nr:SpaA isopeptide-forming pilin-related protein [Lactobacillus equicursoris]CCK83659.1 Cna protein B-type domain protein [Lactobacillus equicursoris 66c]CCK83871.1 Cna protein B-type domain protein [Lactobacillus equicursoris 66c]